jgi:hypothetical protein
MDFRLELITYRTSILFFVSAGLPQIQYSHFQWIMVALGWMHTVSTIDSHAAAFIRIIVNFRRVSAVNNCISAAYRRAHTFMASFSDHWSLHVDSV